MTGARRPTDTAGAAPPLRVAYVMSRFPKITETFVLYEMKAVEAMGAAVEVFPLLRGPRGPRHPDAIPFERRAHFHPFVSWKVVAANARAFVRSPALYVRTLAESLCGTLGSARFFLGAIAFFPKSVAFAEQARAAGVDHVHAHFASHPALAAFVIGRLTGIPFSFTAHGSDLHVERAMLRRKVAEASFVVTVSDYNRELIVAECGDEIRHKVRVIHCGADPTVFAGPSRESTASPAGGSLRVACVASLEEVKGHRFLLEACRLLVNRDVEIHCDLAGDGPLRGRIERLIGQLGLGRHVTLHGALPRSGVRHILKAADVAVLASYPTRSGKREGIPVALMEAMMSELPIVASGLSGIPELVEHGRSGFLVPPGDPWSLADRLECLAGAPPLRRSMGAAGRQKVLSEFDLRAGARLLVHEMLRA